MILHCVFIRFKSALQAAEKQALYEAIATLRNVVPGILDLKAGPNVSLEGLNGGFLDGFIVTFESPEARDAYISAPDHIAVAERLVAAADGGLSGLIVYDLAA
jgi:hypothetical protein